MKKLWWVVLVSLLGLVGCGKDKWKERSGPEDHPRDATNVSGIDHPPKK